MKGDLDDLTDADRGEIEDAIAVVPPRPDQGGRTRIVSLGHAEGPQLTPGIGPGRGA